ncbi:MAG: hypothetical protein MK132_16290 [Lentisphaerales bacterium]|nr:hypothetical protein [Lentisphaerales bacterium]
MESGKVGTSLDDNLMIYYCPANPNRHHSGNGDSATALNSTQRDNLYYGINRDSTAQAAISLQQVA